MGRRREVRQEGQPEVASDGRRSLLATRGRSTWRCSSRQDPEDIDAFQQIGHRRTSRVRAEVEAVERHHKVRLPRPSLTELIHIRSHRGTQLGAEAVVAFGVVADRRRDGDLVSLVEAQGAEQAQVEKFGEQAAVALGKVARRFPGAEKHDPTPGALAAEQFNQRGPETADVCANPNAHQPRPQVSAQTTSCSSASSLSSSVPSALRSGWTRAVISMATGGIAAS